MSPITTHVLDTATGRPAVGIPVVLERLTGQDFATIGQGTTDSDGRIVDLIEEGDFAPGQYRVRFQTADYLTSTGHDVFYPEVAVHFAAKEGETHYHVPLLLSPYGYSTYRGS